MWTARVHKTGTVVQLLKNGKVEKTINASDNTFSPITAKQFAETTVSHLNSKIAKQMTDPSKDPSVATKAEEQAQSLKAVAQDAKGKAVNASDNTITKEAFDKMSEENALLKRTLSKIQKESSIERKARRGLAIVKALVEQGKIANDENVVKAEVEKIASMSNDEITVLERKASGNAPYESKDDANRAARRYARMARLHKQAAEDAQLGDDEDVADAEDLKAARYDELSKEAYSEAGKYTEAGYKNQPEGCKANDAVNQAEKDAKGVDANGKKASEEKKAEVEMKPEITDTMFQAEEEVDEDEDDEDAILDDDVIDDEEEFEDEDAIEVEASAKIYRKIASTHTEKAEALKKEGKEKEAEIELEIAKEASELAENIEKEAQAKQEKVAEDDSVKTAAAIYRKIAADHRKKADEFEALGDDAKADEEDEIAVEAEELANSIEKPEAEACTASTETAKVAEEKTEAKEADSKEIAKSADELTDVVDTDKEVEDAEEKEAMVKNSEDAEDEELLDEDKIIENTAKENAISTDEDAGELPSDEDIDAALAKDVDEEETKTSEEEVEDEVEDAQTDKISSLDRTASADRAESNPMTGQVNELENLWRKEE